MIEYLRSIKEVSGIFLEAGRLIVSEIVEHGTNFIDKLEQEYADELNGLDD